MKPYIPILCAMLGMAGAFLGAQLLESTEPPAPLTPGATPGTSGSAALPADGTAPKPTNRTDARVPVPAEESEPAPPREPTPEERARIFQAVEENRERFREEQAQARVEKQEQEFLRRAEVIADRLSLPAGSATKIAALFSTERERIAIIREEFLAAGQSPESREKLRTQMSEVRKWRDEQLAIFFGREVAADIAKFEEPVKGEEKLEPKGWKPGSKDEEKEE